MEPKKPIKERIDNILRIERNEIIQKIKIKIDKLRADIEEMDNWNFETRLQIKIDAYKDCIEMIRKA